MRQGLDLGLNCMMREADKDNTYMIKGGNLNQDLD